MVGSENCHVTSKKCVQKIVYFFVFLFIRFRHNSVGLQSRLVMDNVYGSYVSISWCIIFDVSRNMYLYLLLDIAPEGEMVTTIHALHRHAHLHVC